MISVVIPTYNNLELSRKAVASALKQRDCEFEIVIVDDSTVNDIENYVKTLDQSRRIRYIHNTPSRGAVPNWNFGLGIAAGDALVLLHHDEEFESENHLCEIASMLKSNDMVVCAKRVIRKGNPRRDRFPSWLKKLWMRMKYPVLGVNYIGPSACVAFRRDLLCELDEKLRWLVDSDWYFRMLASAKNPCYCKSLRIISNDGSTGQITSNIDILATLKSDKEVISKKHHSIRVDFWLMVETLRQRIKKMMH